MSVLACNRVECSNIMCDRLILNDSMYICEDCFKELVVYKESWPIEMTIGEVRDRIETFMRTAPGRHVVADIEAEFKALTGGILR